MFRRSRLCFLTALGTLAGCAPGPRPAAPPRDEQALIQAALDHIQSKKADYKIGATDLLEFSVFQQPDLERKLRVSQNGSVTLPLIGAVRVGGLSTTEAEELIAGKLKEYVINPQVTIFIREYANHRVYVLGEVAKPGSIDLPAEAKLTVLEAVTLAGGFTPVAAADRTKVMRVIDGKSQTLTIEVSAITRRGEKQRDIPLEANDVVYVPQSFF